MRKSVPVLCATALLIALGAAGSLSQQRPKKPVKERTIHTSGGVGAPATLAELYAMSPLVIDATVQGARPVDRQLKTSTSETVLIQTAHTLSINEVFRDTIPRGVGGKRIETVQIGGERDRGEYIESLVDERFPLLRRGERYILFLKPAPSGDGTFVVSTESPDGVFALESDATVKGKGAGKLGRKLERYSQSDLLNALRDLRDSGR